jgi:WD40 repeat protein
MIHYASVLRVTALSRANSRRGLHPKICLTSAGPAQTFRAAASSSPTRAATARSSPEGCARGLRRKACAFGKTTRFDLATNRIRLHDVVRSFLSSRDANNVVFSPDGSLLASVHYNGALKVWDAKSGEELHALPGHGKNALGCAFSADGSFIVSASGDKMLKVRDTKEWVERKTLVGHEGAVKACAVSPDDSLVASASEDGVLKVWDAESGKCLATFYSDGQLNDCKWFSDGVRLMAVGNSGVYFLRLVR